MVETIKAEAIAAEWENLGPNARRMLQTYHAAAYARACEIHLDYKVESIRADWARENEIRARMDAAIEAGIAGWSDGTSLARSRKQAR